MNRAEGLMMATGSTVREALERLNHAGKGIVLITGDGGRLVGTVTDGDVRRALLAGARLDDGIVDAVRRGRGGEAPPPPITAPAQAAASDLVGLMREHQIQHIPLVDAEQRVVDLAVLADLTLEAPPKLGAVVMAGGFGTRLRPLTDNLPKPMLTVGDRPVMEHVLQQLQAAGIHEVSVTTHYKPEAIVDYFGDGDRFGMRIHYVAESEPLGTAGALGLMPEPDRTMVVINGDVLTQVDFRAMHAYHREQRAMMTVGLRQYEIEVPYGVVDMNGSLVVGLTEKPSFRLFVNAGVYLIEPAVFRRITAGQRLDATELIARLIAENEPVAGFPIHEYWLDVGRPDDYTRANREWDRAQH